VNWGYRPFETPPLDAPILRQEADPEVRRPWAEKNERLFSRSLTEAEKQLGVALMRDYVGYLEGVGVKVSFIEMPVDAANCRRGVIADSIRIVQSGISARTLRAHRPFSLGPFETSDGIHLLQHHAIESLASCAAAGNDQLAGLLTCARNSESTPSPAVSRPPSFSAAATVPGKPAIAVVLHRARGGGEFRNRDRRHAFLGGAGRTGRRAT